MTQETFESEVREEDSEACSDTLDVSFPAALVNMVSVLPFKLVLLPYLVYRKILSNIPRKKNTVRFEIIDFITWIWIFVIFYGTKGFSTWQKFPLKMFGFSLLLCLPALIVMYMRKEKYLEW